MTVFQKLRHKLGRFGRRPATRRGTCTDTVADTQLLHDDLCEHFERDLVVVDVGCRWGFAEAWTGLLPRVRLYGFDPDVEECERLREVYQGRNVTLVSQALADAPGKRLLYLTQNPGCSSLYRPDPRLTGAMPELACATEVGTTEVEVTTLDLWSAGAGVDVIDFLKLDTQGSELDILRGGREILGTVRALEVEVEFNPIYENQPLFADVDGFLRGQGFVLWRLSNMVHYSRGEAVPQRQKDDTAYYDSRTTNNITFGGQLYWGHAHYLRQELAGAEQHNDWQQAVRDAALMEALDFSDLARRLIGVATAAGCPVSLKEGH